MKEQYLIIIDLDGTLLQGFDHYDAETFAYLKTLTHQHKLVIATGRPYRSSKYYYDKLGLDTPIINYNGSLVHHPHDADFPKQLHTVSKEAVMNFITDLGDAFVNAFCEIEDDIYLYEESEEMEPYLHLEGGALFVGDFDEILPSDPHGAILVSTPNSDNILTELVEKHYKDELKVRIWHNDDLVISELYPIHASKATGIQTVQSYLNIPHERTIAIGDGHNDLEMIAYVKYGVAMANSHPELLDIAKIHTDSVANKGVMTFLKKFFP